MSQRKVTLNGPESLFRVTSDTIDALGKLYRGRAILPQFVVNNELSVVSSAPDLPEIAKQAIALDHELWVKSMRWLGQPAIRVHVKSGIVKPGAYHTPGARAYHTDGFGVGMNVPEDPERSIIIFDTLPTEHITGKVSARHPLGKFVTGRQVTGFDLHDATEEALGSGEVKITHARPFMANGFDVMSIHRGVSNDELYAQPRTFITVDGVPPHTLAYL